MESIDNHKLDKEIQIEQIIPYHLQETSVKLLKMVYMKLHKHKTSNVLKYLGNEYQLQQVPISESEFQYLDDTIYDDSDIRFGKYRTPEKKLSIDISHAKRIRSSENKNDNFLDVLITSKSHFQALPIDKVKKLCELFEVEQLNEFEVEIPARMIYIREVYDKFKTNWPIQYSNQPPGFQFITHKPEEMKALNELVKKLKNELCECVSGECILTDSKFNILCEQSNKENDVKCLIDHPVMVLAQKFGNQILEL